MLVAQSCLTLWDSMDCRLPASSVWISQTRILEWVAIPVSRGSVLFFSSMYRISCVKELFMTDRRSSPGCHASVLLPRRLHLPLAAWCLGTDLPPGPQLASAESACSVVQGQPGWSRCSLEQLAVQCSQCRVPEPP